MADHGTIGTRKFLRLTVNVEDKTVKGKKSQRKKIKKV